MSKSSGSNRGLLSEGSKLYREKLKSTETNIRTKRYEVGVVLDRKGNILVRREGTAREVRFSKEELKLMKDNVLTHNHPSALGRSGVSAIGNPFSKKDLILAVARNVKEIRAVTPTYTFSIKRPKGGWKVNWKDISKAVDYANRKYRKKLNSYIWNYKGKEPTARLRANALHWHLVNKEVAKKMGWNYTHKKAK